jgi:hypothetical protein
MSNPRRSARIAGIAAQRAVISNAAVPAPQVAKKQRKPTTKNPKRKRDDPMEVSTPAKRQKTHAQRNPKRKRDDPVEVSAPAKRQKTHTDQREDAADIQSTGDGERVTEQALGDEASSLAENQTTFLGALISTIPTLRFSDQKRAARTKCLTEQSQLQVLLNFYRPSLLNVPGTNEYLETKGSVSEKVQKYDALLERRVDQEEILTIEIECLVEHFEALKDRLETYLKPSATVPELGCLENSADFQAIFKRCQSHSATIADLEVILSNVAEEEDQVNRRIEDHAKRVLARGSGQIAHREDTEPAEGAYSPEQDLENSMGILKWRRQLNVDLKENKQTLSGLEEDLLRFAQTQMVESGILQSVVTDPEDPAATSEEIEPLPQAAIDAEAARQKEEADAEAAILEEKARKDALVAELSSAQEVFWNALKVYQDESRKLNEEELRNLTPPVTEEKIGIALVHKLSRTTRDYLEAEKRVNEARRAAHQAGLVD